tara:strand:+ start:33 stop:353 length:321 start_codon:yes stop_codon:yes gene_type:complete
MKITKKTLRRIIKEELETFINEVEEESLEIRMKRVMSLPDLSLDDKMKEIMSLISADPTASAEIQARQAAQALEPDPNMVSGFENDGKELSHNEKMRQSLQRKLKK